MLFDIFRVLISIYGFCKRDKLKLGSEKNMNRPKQGHPTSFGSCLASRCGARASSGAPAFFCRIVDNPQTSLPPAPLSLATRAKALNYIYHAKPYFSPKPSKLETLIPSNSTKCFVYSDRWALCKMISLHRLPKHCWW